MSIQQDLRGCRILVTRPAPAGKNLCEVIQLQGGEAIYFPTIEIESISYSPIDFHSYSWIIFTSPQAVYHGMEHPMTIPSTVKIAAIGPGTVHALNEYDIVTHVYPVNEWNSEGLLALPEFQKIAQQKIAIVKGKGGRALLEEYLTKRGAIATSINVYQRILPKIEVKPYLDLLRTHGIDVIICTSNEGLLNLKILLQKAWSYLQNVIILVISERIKKNAIELGFNNILLADNVSDHAMFAAIKRNRI